MTITEDRYRMLLGASSCPSRSAHGKSSLAKPSRCSVEHFQIAWGRLYVVSEDGRVCVCSNSIRKRTRR